MDVIDKHIKELFKDLVRHMDNPLINEPIDLYSYEELEEHTRDGWKFRSMDMFFHNIISIRTSKLLL